MFNFKIEVTCTILLFQVVTKKANIYYVYYIFNRIFKNCTTARYLQTAHCIDLTYCSKITFLPLNLIIL